MHGVPDHGYLNFHVNVSRFLFFEEKIIFSFALISQETTANFWLQMMPI